jgi:hypothetical protein
MPECIYCRSAFDQATREHVLQNVLGARWDTPLIACNGCQAYFSQTIDPAFERRLESIRNPFGTRGGLGGEARPLTDITTTAGGRIDLTPGGGPARPEHRRPGFLPRPREGRIQSAGGTCRHRTGRRAPGRLRPDAVLLPRGDGHGRRPVCGLAARFPRRRRRRGPGPSGGCGQSNAGPRTACISRLHNSRYSSVVSVLAGVPSPQME